MAIDYVNTHYPDSNEGAPADNTLYVDRSKKGVWVGDTKIGGDYDTRCSDIENSIIREAGTRDTAINDIKKNAVHNNRYYIRYVPIVGASERAAASTNGCSISRAYFKESAGKYTQITKTDTGNETPNSENCPVGACRGLIFGSDDKNKDKYTYAEVLIPLDGSHRAMSPVKDNTSDIAVGVLGIHMYNISFDGILSSFSIQKTKDPETNPVNSNDFVRLLFIFPSIGKRNIIDKGVKKEIAGKEGADYIKLSKGIKDANIGYKQFKNSFKGSYVEVLFKRSESD